MVLLPDGGRGYLSKVFNDDWMADYGFLQTASERTVGDVLLRRTRLALQEARVLQADDAAVERVARAMAPDLGWDEARISTEVAAFREEAREEGIVVAEAAPA